ncbi:MAG: TonB-dependent receptor [Novosphingobium sp.]
MNFTNCTSVATHPLCADGRFGFYTNVGKVRARGVELGTSVRFGAFSASANYTYLDAQNMTPGDSNLGKRLARRPRNTFNGTVSYTWPFKLETAASVHVSGNSYNDAANNQLLKRYTLVDFRLSYPITDKIELYARVENAFDEKYQTVLNYGTYPRTAFGGVRVKM